MSLKILFLVTCGGSAFGRPPKSNYSNEHQTGQIVEKFISTMAGSLLHLISCMEPALVDEM